MISGLVQYGYPGSFAVLILTTLIFIGALTTGAGLGAAALIFLYLGLQCAVYRSVNLNTTIGFVWVQLVMSVLVFWRFRKREEDLLFVFLTCTGLAGVIIQSARSIL